MSARVLIDGRDAAGVSADDRGLLYGDGVFETIRFVAGSAPLWGRHMQRLAEGCARMVLPAPDVDLLAAEARGVAGATPAAVVRITLTRGVGQRGYALPVPGRPTRIVAAYPVPMVPGGWYRDGVRVRSCALRLSAQPRLAGIKHLNRLEQVLARAEWSDPEVAEGLLCDHDGHLVGATAANVFVVAAGVLLTPAVDQCGVAGVLRAELLAAMPRARVMAIGETMRVEEMFLCSSVRGVLPVRDWDGRCLPVGPQARAAQAHWHGLGFAGGGA